MSYYKDDPRFAATALAPAHPITTLPASGELRSLAATYNTIGGLVDTLAGALAIDPMAVLAVWYVESGSYPFVPNKPVLRFENHKFWKYWGVKHPAVFDQHFRFGGHPDPGKPQSNHMFRNPVTAPWHPFHGDQAREYEVFDFAAQISDLDSACMSASFGGTQVMGFNHDALGYADAASLFKAFGADLRWQVLGFFDFCKSNGLIRDIKDQAWTDFGAGYNGDGGTYGPRLAAAFALKAKFLALPR